MYNQAYIDDYNENVYINFLRNNNKLIDLKNAYLNQYTDKSNASLLSFKESLDHYVKMKLLTDNSFINSIEFYNYLCYIMTIVNNKITKLADGNYIYSELISNVVFENEQLRNQIINKFFSANKRDGLNRVILNSKNQIENIFKKMREGQELSQSMVDLAGDYIYSSRNLSNNYDSFFAKYILNCSAKYNIKASVPIIGAMTTIFTNFYDSDEEVKNSRFYIAEYDGKRRVNVAHSSGLYRYCVFQKNAVESISLSGGKSILKSRTLKDIDIYWLMFATFHELTHQHQMLEVRRQKLTSSGLCQVVSQVLLELMPKVKKSNRVYDDYCVNHDADESEMEADENGWRLTRAFIYTNVNRDKRMIVDDDGNEFDAWILALSNVRIIQARRTFSIKKTVNDLISNSNLPKTTQSKGMYYAIYDILNLERCLNKNPKIMEKYPMLKKFFDNNGNMLSLDILKMNIYRDSQRDVHDEQLLNNMGLQFGTYALIYKWNDIVSDINNGKINNAKEIETIYLNMWDIVHELVLKVRKFNEIQRDQYDETQTRFDFDNSTNTKYLYEYYFKCVVIGALRFNSYRELIKRKYNIVLDDQLTYYSSWIYELYNNLIDKDDASCRNVLNQLKLSGEPNLVEIFDTIMQKRNKPTK